MTWHRISIRALMASVVLFAVGGAALRSASPLWASIIFSLTLGILATAVLGSLFSRRSRPFWSGFVLFGWGYMTLVFSPWFKDQVHPHLFTTRIIASTADHLLDATKFEPEIITVFPLVPIAHQAFYHIAHSLFTLLNALIGGVIARGFAGATGPEVDG